jgi:hypothetical protein
MVTNSPKLTELILADDGDQIAVNRWYSFHLDFQRAAHRTDPELLFSLAGVGDIRVAAIPDEQLPAFW